jgi:quinol monooxygenase YgiN
MAIRIVSNVSVDPDAVDDYLAYWRMRSDQCRAEAGCTQYQVFQSIEVPNEFALLEGWEDQQTYDAHWAAQRAIPGRPVFPRVPPTRGRDGLEFYFDQQYFHLEDGQWVPDNPTSTQPG